MVHSLILIFEKIYNPYVNYYKLFSSFIVNKYSTIGYIFYNIYGLIKNFFDFQPSNNVSIIFILPFIFYY